MLRGYLTAGHAHIPSSPPRIVRSARRRRAGLSLRELLISIGIITLLAGFIMAVVSRSRTAAQNATCLTRLHSVSGGLSQWAHDHSDRYPDPIALNQSWEQCLYPYISSSQNFQCPADEELFPAVGSSYDWRDTSVATTTLAGRTVHDINRLDAVLVFESLPSWHMKGRMNAAHIDGSAQTMTQEKCLSDLQTPIR